MNIGERHLEKKSGKHTAKSRHGLLKEVTKSDLFSMLGSNTCQMQANKYFTKEPHAQPCVLSREQFNLDFML